MANGLRHSPTEQEVVPKIIELIERHEAERLAVSGLAKVIEPDPELDTGPTGEHESAETLSPEAGPTATDG